MANIAIPLSSLAPQKDQDKSANVSVAATTDTAIVPVGTRGTILAVVNGATTTNVTVAHGAAGEFDLTFQVNNGKTRFIYITDSSLYQQPDGKLHVTADQATSMYALAITHGRT